MKSARSFHDVVKSTKRMLTKKKGAGNKPRQESPLPPLHAHIAQVDLPEKRETAEASILDQTTNQNAADDASAPCVETSRNSKHPKHSRALRRSGCLITKGIRTTFKITAIKLRGCIRVTIKILALAFKYMLNALLFVAVIVSP